MLDADGALQDQDVLVECWRLPLLGKAGCSLDMSNRDGAAERVARGTAKEFIDAYLYRQAVRLLAP
jgi:hypothetical protein